MKREKPRAASWQSRPRLNRKQLMQPILSHQEQIFSAIDRYFDTERNMLDARRDLARALAITWLEHQANDQAVQTRPPIAAEIAPAQHREPLMTVEDLAAYLAIKPQTIRDWARLGRIPCERANSEIRFRRSAIDQWMKPDSKDKIEKSSPTQSDTVVKSSRSFLRPQNRSKSNGRV